MGPIDEHIPPLNVACAKGVHVRAWDYKQKRNLLVLVLDAGVPVPEEFLKNLAAASEQLEALETTVLLALPGSLPSFSLPLPPPAVVGVASEESLHAWLSISGRIGLFLADRYGELYARWLVSSSSDLPPVEEVFSWLFQMEIACEECGVSDWPPR